MSQPIKHQMTPRGSYDPYVSRPTPTDKIRDRFMSRAADRHRDDLVELARSMGDIEVRSMKPNKTGRKINLRVRVGGKAMGFSVFPYEAKGTRSRTADSLAEEVATVLLQKTEYELPSTVSKTAEIMFKESRAGKDPGNVHFGTYHSNSFLADWMQYHVPPGFLDFVRAVNSFVGAGSLDKGFDAHQVKRALGQYRDMALHALRHGAKLDEMQTILNEAVVEVTMEA